MRSEKKILSNFRTMTKLFRLTYTFLLAITLSLLFTGCIYDRFDEFGTDYGDGFGDLQVQVEFENLSPALETRATGGTAGDAIGPVSNLQMVIYSYSNGTATFRQRVVCNSLSDYTIDQQGNSAEPSDAQTGNDQHAGGQFESTGEQTGHATFSIKDLPYGAYKIYAVANVPNLTDEQCQTEESLKSIQFKWDSGNVANNKAMFGYFSHDNGRSSGFDAPIIAVNKPSVSIHSWIRRLASKVTVAFDPSELKEAVTVYIKSVTIHDIPDSCRLGVDNKPGPNDKLLKGETIDYSNGSSDYKKWEIQLQKGSGKKGSNHSNNDPNSLFFFENMQGDFSNAPNKKDYLKEQIPDETGTSIDEPGDNLYGDETGPKDNDFKDRVKYGSYIEVIGYYVSNNSEKMSSGNIKYRFMLGKDIMYNYDAERNYHYKLTLKFRGFANEADWHIVYTEPTPSLYTPDQYYVSYLYGQESAFPVRIITGDPEHTSRYTLKAEIIENPWWPYDEDSDDGYPPSFIGNGDDPNGFAWMKATVVSVPSSESAGQSSTYYKGENKDYAGFLSLRKPETVPGKPDVYADIKLPDAIETNGRDYGTKHSEGLRKYYNDNNVAHAAYSLDAGTHNVGLYDINSSTLSTGKSTDGQYNVSKDADGSVTLKIPMYTRPLKMSAGTDFTGNNPYPSFQRRAKVRFMLFDEKGDSVQFRDLANNEIKVYHRDVPIIQVRRIENPKAIYRAHDNTQPFDVVLMHRRHRNGVAAESYEDFESIGPWRAIILKDPKGLVQLSKGGTVVQGEGKSVEGSGGEKIAFTYTPNGTCGATETRCAIIKVEYHDYTCNHLIFVRQGYDKGVKLADANWSLYQVYAAKGNNSNDSFVPEPSTNSDNYTVSVAVTKSPLSIGSLMKRCQYNWCIREAQSSDCGWLKNVTQLYYNKDGETENDGYGQPKHIKSQDLSVAKYDGTNVWTVDTIGWGSIQGFGWWDFGGSNARYERQWAKNWNAKINGATKKLTVPTYGNYENLRDQCDFGFGIAYADGATKTAKNLDDAYGYIDATNTGATSANGVRACVAYDKSNGNSILFPLGKVGHGRRAAGGATLITSKTDFGVGSKRNHGVQSYGGLASVLWQSAAVHRPITYNHYRTPGAVYWVKKAKYVHNAGETYADKQASYASWDINYFTCTFNNYSSESLGNFKTSDSPYGKANSYTCSDALPMKLIYQNDDD